ncbi:MAG: FRG domain-containing protein, partial [Planctomycetota bacterium]
MIFHEEQILDTSQILEWSDLMTTVRSRLAIDEWIFRALKKGPDNNCLEILSHFDEAWKRRKEPGGSKQFYEAWMLHEFRREAYHYLSNLPERGDLLEWLSLGRHYGMPVRLVDFTYSFYIAV